MTHSSISIESECSATSRSNSDLCDCSSLEGSVSLPKRATYSDFSRNGNRGIVSEGDSLWCAEYAQDIFSYLRRIENTRRAIMYRSPQIYYRASLIALIKRIAETEKLGRTTVHLAVYMLDVFMDTYKIVTTKLNLVAFVCLLVAAKIEERDQNIPKICTLNSYTNDQYTRTDFKSLERMILSFFNWAVLVPTTATFIESYVHDSVTSEEIPESLLKCEFGHSSRMEPEECAIKNVSDTCKSLVLEFLEVTLCERRLVHVKPSLLSAACLAASRKLCGINTIWPQRLQTLTAYSYEMLQEYVETLLCLRNYQNQKSIEKVKRTPDSGCITDSGSETPHDEDDFQYPLPVKKQRLTY